MSKSTDDKRSLGFETLRVEFPAIFRFGDIFFMEEFDIDNNYYRFGEIRQDTAERWCGRSLT